MDAVLPKVAKLHAVKHQPALVPSKCFPLLHQRRCAAQQAATTVTKSAHISGGRPASLAGQSCAQTQRHTSAACCSTSMACASTEPALPPPQTPPVHLWRPVLVRVACSLAVLLAVTTLLPESAAAKAASTASGGTTLAGILRGILDFALHLDKHLADIIAHHGRATYGILFAIVFCETGLVLTPFLPGDSLLFAAGAFAALGSLALAPLLAVFIVAATLGDAVNYAAGNFLGARAIQSGIVKQEYIKKTQQFYAKYGGKTVVLARFVPIVRTFAPFVAGVGSMAYRDFALYNVGGAVLWSVLFVGAGYLFGNLPFVQHNFTLVVLAIVVLSVVPVALEVLAARREPPEDADDASPSTPAAP